MLKQHWLYPFSKEAEGIVHPFFSLAESVSAPFAQRVALVIFSSQDRRIACHSHGKVAWLFRRQLHLLFNPSAIMLSEDALPATHC